MIEELKKIMIEKYNSEYENAEKEYEKIEKKLEDNKRKISVIKHDASELNYGMTQPISYNSFNFIQRFFTKRAEYKKYQQQKEEYNKNSKKYEEIENKLETLRTEQKEIEIEKEQKKKETKLEEKKERLQKVKDATVIRDLGLDVFSAIKILEDNNLPVILTENDKVITENERDYSSKSSLIGVHKTKFAPAGGIIKSNKDAKVMHKRKIILNNKEYEYEFMSERDTVHMALNGEVVANDGGNWEDCKYAILIPIKDIPNEKIGCACPVDTFTKGSLTLSQNSWVLCPFEEVEKIKNNNKNIHVIGYKGESVLGFSTPFLTALGYRGEGGNNTHWRDDKSANQFDLLKEKEGWEGGLHANTYFYEDEDCLTNINAAVEIFKIITKNGLLKNKESISNISEQLINDWRFFYGIRAVSNNGMYIPEYHEEAIVQNKRHFDIFFSKMKENGINISDNYKAMIRSVSEAGAGIKQIDIEKLSQSLDNLTEDEKMLLEDLKNAIVKKNLKDERTIEREHILEKFYTRAICNSIVRSKEKNEKNQSKDEDELER